MISIHTNFKIQSWLEGIEVVNKLRGKISHACNSVVRILITTRTKQLHGKSCNLENFANYLLFLVIFFLQQQGALLFQQSYQHRCTGRGARGAAAPQILSNSDFLGSEGKFGQNQFFKTFPFFLNHNFEGINIFYFNLKSA